MIHMEEVSFSYHGTKEILKEISLDLGAGHFLALLGNNGAGKSTLMKCLNRILEPQRGVVRVSGEDVRSMPRRDIAKSMAYVEQQTDVGQLTVYDSVLLGRKPYIKMNSTQKDLDITEQMIKRMNLEPFKLRYTDELSGGEFQKVVLARALAQQPDILLLDEPTSNLDLKNQHEVMQSVKEITKKENISAIVVIHDLNLALRYCDRFLFIKDGLVYEYGDETIITDEVISEVYHVEAKVIEVKGHKLVIVDV